MAIARTGVYVDDYLECKFLHSPLILHQFSIFDKLRALFLFWISTDANTLPAELQRLLNTIRELDDRSQCKKIPLPHIRIHLRIFLFTCVSLVCIHTIYENLCMYINVSIYTIDEFSCMYISFNCFTFACIYAYKL